MLYIESCRWLHKSYMFHCFVSSVTAGSLSVGTISADDRTSDYGSAATADYKPYISDPGVTAGQTTRMLRNRYSAANH